MAKFETTLHGSLSSFQELLKDQIISGSMTASLEDESRCQLGDTVCCVQVYERYSTIGSNRVSMNVTMLERDGIIHLIGITAGGSQAMFFKVNTFGEEAFLDCLRDAVENYQQK